MVLSIIDIILKNFQMITNDTSIIEKKGSLELGVALSINKPKMQKKIEKGNFPLSTSYNLRLSIEREETLELRGEYIVMCYSDSEITDKNDIDKVQKDISEITKIKIITDINNHLKKTALKSVSIPIALEENQNLKINEAPQVK